MGQRTHLRLHMGCGEALRSRLALGGDRRQEGGERSGAGQAARALTSRCPQRTGGGNKHS